MDNNLQSTDTTIISIVFAMISWITIGDVQVFVSISAGLIACFAGVTTIIKNKRK